LIRSGFSLVLTRLWFTEKSSEQPDFSRDHFLTQGNIKNILVFFCQRLPSTRPCRWLCLMPLSHHSLITTLVNSTNSLAFSPARFYLLAFGAGVCCAFSHGVSIQGWQHCSHCLLPEIRYLVFYSFFPAAC